VHCQLDTLRRCFPPSIRHVLGELPRTLDETYERILKEIDAEKKAYAHRLFQCLVVAIRPLRVNELAELFAVLPDTGSTPGFNISWRPEDPEEFILSACSTLVAIVDVSSKMIVQFSHFSVREYLTSGRIATSAPVSHFHILPKPAHTLLAKACLSVLLQLNDSIYGVKTESFPLTSYAAKHWADHALFEDVSSEIRDGMHCLFDKRKPHFATWVNIFNFDNSIDFLDDWSYGSVEPRGVLNARGGRHETPLLAALNKEHPDIAQLLLEHGADVESRWSDGPTALIIASSLGTSRLCGY
jgi:Ankyrin repeats (many copies)